MLLTVKYVRNYDDVTVIVDGGFLSGKPGRSENLMSFREMFSRG